MESGALQRAPTSSFPRNTVGYIQSGTLRVLNRALVKLPFKMLTQRRLFQCVRPFDWVAAIDLKDAYFHVSILPRFRFAYKGASIPVGPSPSGTSAGWGFRSTGKRANSPLCRGSLFSARSWTRSTSQHVSQRSVLSQCWDAWSLSSARRAVPLKHFQRLLGHMASSAAITPLGLLHMRPLQRLASRPSPEMGMAPRHIPGLTHPVLPSHLQPVVGSCLSSGRSPLEQVSRHVVVSTDASATGLGGHVQRARQPRGSGQGPSASGISIASMCWQYSLLCAASERCYTEKAYTGPLGQHCDRCVHQGGLRSRRMSQLARHLLLWSQKHLRSLRAVHVPGELNRAADELSRQHALPGRMETPPPRYSSWFGDASGDAQVDLVLPPRTRLTASCFSPCPRGPSVTDALACSWPRGLRKYAFPPVSLLAQTLCKVREDEEQVLLVAPYWPNRTWFPELMLLATAPPWQIPLRRDLLSQRGGTLWHPRPDLWNLHVWSLDGTRRF